MKKAMKSKYICILAGSLLVLSLVSGVPRLVAQEGSETTQPAETVAPAPETAAEQQPSEAAPVQDKKPAREKKAPKPAPQATAPAPVEKVGGAVSSETLGEGLLLVPLGESLNERIPDIVIKKKASNGQGIVPIPGDSESTGDQKSREKGLFGMSEKATENIAKISIALLVIFMFVLYRIRARSSGRSVLSSMPKK